ncbi:MAG: MFS transporter [Gammaproteobacteria bacterium]|nr:MAG: MFS transporter [Gammaproteobacteria bacterium]
MKKWMLLITLSMSMFIIVIDTTIMNVSISALIEDLDTSVGGIQAAIALYALVMAAFMLIGGKLADIIGKKRTFIAGVIIFGIGTFIASISQSLTMLIIGWSIIEGLGSALMMPNIQTLLRDKYDGSDRAFAYGIVSAVAAIGAAVGPIVGGFLTTYYTWRWAFRFEVVIVIAVVILTRYITADKRPATRPRFDILGALLSISGWSALVLGILLGQSYGFWYAKQPFIIGSLEIAPLGLSVVPMLMGLGLILIMLLFSWEQQLEEKGGGGLFKPSLLKTPGLIPGFTVRFVQMGTMAAFLFTMPLLFQLSFEYTAMQTGQALIPFSIGLLVFAVLGARLSARYSARRIIQVGFLLVITGLLIIAGTIKPDAEPSDLATGVVFGMGIGLIASQILNLILSSVSAEDTAEASGLNGTFEQLGNAIGVALVGTLMLGGLTASIENSINTSPTVPEQHKAAVVAATASSITLMSDTQLKAELSTLGVNPAVEAEIQSVYSLARTQAFQAGISFLVFIALLGLVKTIRLPKHKLVET